MRTEDFSTSLDAAKDGDEDAFVVLFRGVQPVLLRYLRAMTPELCDDVAGETWAAVVRGLDGFAGGESGFRAWVFAIARARLVDARRAAGRSPVPVDAGAARSPCGQRRMTW
jgi:RNA polymerase sigma-70 factor (ECF subfamily)